MSSESEEISEKVHEAPARRASKVLECGSYNILWGTISVRENEVIQMGRLMKMNGSKVSALKLFQPTRLCLHPRKKHFSEIS